MNKTEPTATRVRRDERGVYTWTYAMSLYKNPTVFWLVWKIFFFIILGIFALMIVVDAVEWGGFSPDRLLSTLTAFGCALAVSTALVALGYLLYAAMMGGRYVVEFEMDQQRVVHRQIASQAKKARRIGRAAMFAGAASGRLTAVGVGLNAQRTEMITEFSRVKKVKVCPRRHLIKVNETLAHNQVYAAPEDFDFVAEYIRSHCPNVKE